MLPLTAAVYTDPHAHHGYAQLTDSVLLIIHHMYFTNIYYSTNFTASTLVIHYHILPSSTADITDSNGSVLMQRQSTRPILQCINYFCQLQLTRHTTWARNCTICNLLLVTDGVTKTLHNKKRRFKINTQ